MVKIVDKTLIADTPYSYDVQPWMLTRSLSHHFFAARLKHSFPGTENDVALVDARNPDKNVIRGNQLELLSRKVATGLKGMGLKKNDAILLMVHNNVDFFCPVFGTWFLGGSANVVSPILSPANLAKQLSTMNIRHVFCGPGSITSVIEGIKLLNHGKEENQIKKTFVIVMDSVDPDFKGWQQFAEAENQEYEVKSYSDLIKENEPLKDEECPEVFSEADDSIIFWSSGTTGDPKGIAFNFNYFLRILVTDDNFFAWPHMEGQKFLVTTNLFHGGGFSFTLFHGLRNGQTCVIFTPKTIESALTVDEIFLAIDKYKTDVLMVGSHHAILMGHTTPSQDGLDLSSVRWVMPMGAPVHLTLPEELKMNFPNFEYLKILYGMTETMLMASWNDPSALGELDRGVQVRIVDNDSSTYDHVTLLGANQVGEIQARTPFMMKGYLDKSLNAKFWTKDGFGRTGDLGYYRDDGILCFSGRLKDLIKYQGNHLYPKELEMIIQKHPGVVEVVVFGLPDPDVQELVTALVIPRNGYSLTEDEIKGCLVDAGVESFKYIRGGVKFVKSFPKNATGKIERCKLPEWYLTLS